MVLQVVGENVGTVGAHGVGMVVVQVVDGQVEGVDVEDPGNDVAVVGEAVVEDGVVLDDVNGVEVGDVLDVVMVFGQSSGDMASENVVDVVDVVVA